MKKDFFLHPKPPRFVEKIVSNPGYIKFSYWTHKLNVPLSILWSFVIVFLVELLSRHTLRGALSFITLHPIPYIYNSYVVFVILSIAFLVNRRKGMRLALTGGILYFAYVNCLVLLSRVTPFGFTDMYMFNDLFSMKNTNYFTAKQATFTVIISIIFAVLCIVITIFEKSYKSKKKFILRLALVGALFLSVPLITQSLQKSGQMSAYFGNLAQGYQDYGFLYGFGMSVFEIGMDKPTVYNEEEVDKYLAESNQGPSLIDAEDGPNIIVMLLESFYDPYETEFLEMSEDPIPFYRKLKREYSSGTLTVPVVGAGTCNSEFEVLTGMSCQFLGPGEYPQKTILKKTDCESFAYDLDQLGYKSHVVHNNGGNFYSRKNAFSMMGFDSFTSKEMLDITEYTPLRTWPRDNILIQATKDALDSTPGKDFVYTISVETHGNYPTNKVLNPPDIEVTAVGKDQSLENQWEYYINMLHREDEFIRQYIEMLDSRDEPTLVIMFGDHLPTLGLESYEQKSGSLYTTAYATWNNFSMTKKNADLTSYQLVSEYLNRLGIHGGTILDYNQSAMNKGYTANSPEYMKGLEVLQYDLLYGNRYAYKDEDITIAKDIEMGVLPIEIYDTFAFAGKLHIYGENFTSWSNVYNDDKPVRTAYLSGQVLSVNLEDLDMEKPIRVCQMGSGSTIFKSSKEIYLMNLDR